MLIALLITYLIRTGKMEQIKQAYHGSLGFIKRGQN